ncbi:ferredoxin--NADP reductase [Thalassotalea euphylliae]|uniref:Uncharacterized protein n=1 Tax=Thalassotalea euphylliae TaxID=1655234 RepID=A0A3E0U3Z6_9GAMM|nr:ferredoxin--NADP reductase [Thalassotalea euphylliae]REL30915.1 hypothetical protein DXX94_09385 [Thalassotalea euphylliae]
MDFFNLKIREVIKETKHAKSFLLDVPTNLAGSFSWQPGQHVNIRVKLGDKSYIRSYSLSNCPQTLGLRLTIKSVELGAVSNFLLKNVKAGQYLEVSKPGGLFNLPKSFINHATTQQDLNAPLHHIFFAAGSGITPIFSMITALLMAKQTPRSKVYLIYSNRNQRNTIFADKLQVLVERFPDRFTLMLCHSKPSWFGRKHLWHKGRVTNTVVQSVLGELTQAKQAVYYLCGPNGFMETVHQALQQADIDKQFILQESFGAGGKNNTAKASASQAAELSVELSGQQQTVNVEANESLLDAMLRANIDAPFSCEEGVCGSCQCQLISGEVAMVENLFLTDEEQAQGSILSCQAIAQSTQVKIRL